jgi:hypothetical protein
MFLYYEVFNEGSSNPDEELYEFVMSSDGRSSKIAFYDPAEKAAHTVLTQVFKTLPLSVCDSDATTYVRTIIGASNGKRITAILESFKTQGLLPRLELKKIKNLQKLLSQERLNYVEPPKKKGNEVDIKFNEEDFFYKPTGGANELSGEALWKALSSILDVTVDSLRNAQAPELKKLYRVRALELHPDRNAGDGSKMSELNYLWRLYNA